MNSVAKEKWKLASTHFTCSTGFLWSSLVKTFQDEQQEQCCMMLNVNHDRGLTQKRIPGVTVAEERKSGVL